MATTAKQPASLQSRVDVAKSLMALARDLGLAILLLLLLLWPSAIAGRLETAGFTEGGWGSWKWKARVDDSSRAIDALATENRRLKQRLAVSDVRMRQLAAKVGPEAVANANRVHQQNLRVQSSAQVAAASATAALADNQNLIASESKGQLAPKTWGVVFGGDRTLEQARFEIRRAEKAGIASPAIYFRDGSFRSVAVVPAGEPTLHVLEKARALRRDSYPIRLATWCPNPIQRDDHFVCG